MGRHGYLKGSLSSRGQVYHINSRDFIGGVKDIELGLRKVLGEDAKQVARDPQTLQNVGNAILTVVGPYVPYKTGELYDTAYATKDGKLSWGSSRVDYAQERYEVRARHYTKKPHPKATAHWVEKALAERGLGPVYKLLKSSYAVSSSASLDIAAKKIKSKSESVKTTQEPKKKKTSKGSTIKKNSKVITEAQVSTPSTSAWNKVHGYLHSKFDNLRNRFNKHRKRR